MRFAVRRFGLQAARRVFPPVEDERLSGASARHPRRTLPKPDGRKLVDTLGVADMISPHFFQQTDEKK